MKNSLINQIKTLLGMEVKLEQMKLMDGVTVLEADIFEAGNEVFIVTEDEQKIPLPVGEYEFEDGRMLIVVEEGMISEVKEKEMEEPEVEVEVETEKKEEMETEKPTAKKTIESVTLSTDEEVKPISFNPENENKVETIRIASKRERTMMDSILEKLNK